MGGGNERMSCRRRTGRRMLQQIGHQRAATGYERKPQRLGRPIACAVHSSTATTIPSRRRHRRRPVTTLGRLYDVLTAAYFAGELLDDDARALVDCHCLMFVLCNSGICFHCPPRLSLSFLR